jgi:hypothetical protein
MLANSVVKQSGKIHVIQVSLFFIDIYSVHFRFNSMISNMLFRNLSCHLPHGKIVLYSRILYINVLVLPD